MNLLPTPSLTISAPVLRARLASRGPAQINDSNTLGSEGADDERRHAAGDRRTDMKRLSHFGTDNTAPLWNGPRLNPAFVAQVLGQVMMEQREPASARPPLAYRAAQIAPGAFFDRGT